VLEEAGKQTGYVKINVGKTTLISYDIVAHVKDIHSVVSLNNDDLGE